MKTPEKPKSLPGQSAGDYMTVQKDITKPMQPVEPAQDPGPILTPPEQYKEEEVIPEKEQPSPHPADSVDDKDLAGNVGDKELASTVDDKHEDASPPDKTQIELSSPDPGHIEVQVEDIQVRGKLSDSDESSEDDFEELPVVLPPSVLKDKGPVMPTTLTHSQMEKYYYPEKAQIHATTDDSQKVPQTQTTETIPKPEEDLSPPLPPPPSESQLKAMAVEETIYSKPDKSKKAVKSIPKSLENGADQAAKPKVPPEPLPKPGAKPVVKDVIAKPVGKSVKDVAKSLENNAKKPAEPKTEVRSQPAKAIDGEKPVSKYIRSISKDSQNDVDQAPKPAPEPEPIIEDKISENGKDEAPKSEPVPQPITEPPAPNIPKSISKGSKQSIEDEIITEETAAAPPDEKYQKVLQEMRISLHIEEKLLAKQGKGQGQEEDIIEEIDEEEVATEHAQDKNISPCMEYKDRDDSQDALITKDTQSGGSSVGFTCKSSTDDNIKVVQTEEPLLDRIITFISPRWQELRERIERLRGPPIYYAHKPLFVRILPLILVAFICLIIIIVDAATSPWRGYSLSRYNIF